VGYYFAKALNRELHCPVGIIHSSWGGTPVEAWTSVEGLKHDPELSRAANRIRENKSAFPQTLAAYAEQFSSWSKQYERGDRPVLDANAAFAMEPSNVDWKPISIPSNTPAELPKAGAIWFRRTFTIPAEAANLQQPLYLGKIRGFYKAYLNGEKIAEVNPGTGNPAAGPVYLKPNLVRKGPAVLAIRIFNPSAPPILEPARPLRFMGQDLSGSWTFCEDGALPPLSGEGLHAMPKMPDQPPQDRLSPSYLYNAMIAPLVPYGIRGIIWYQGESNASRGWQYRTAFPLLIEDWRSKWDEKDLPFYYCQLANNGAKKNVPTDSGWADLREAQSLALRLPNTGQAILIDAGEADDIHWRNKVIAGERLARIALANSYGKSMDFSGPVYQSSRLEEGRITIVFSKVKGRLKAAPLPETYQPRSTLPQSVPLIRNSPESELEGFAICGEDRKWVWAQARIEGNTVVVWSPQVKRPVAVRYAWATNPTCNLTDDSGLPAGPFRTDDFPLMTRHSRY